MSAWTPERLAEAKALLAEHSAAEVGRRLGCSKSAVLGAVYRDRHATAKPPRPARSAAVGRREPEWWARARQYAGDGHSKELIAALCDRSVEAVRTALDPARRERRRLAAARRAS
ncbi:MAG: hypothetical protein DI566_13355 [Microbacterium sp.]|nr:MAG: hypothetical protein DI566_13355 [Microbacterium sp.]